MKQRVAAIGECMLELSAAGGDAAAGKLQLAYGGDTLNTAVYLARLGTPVDYVTLLGDDDNSDWLREVKREKRKGETQERERKREERRRREKKRKV